jgi:hypothetical protein
MTKIMPWLTGTACLFYIFGWIEGLQYPAWAPLLWCFACFMNDLHNYQDPR